MVGTHQTSIRNWLFRVPGGSPSKVQKRSKLLPRQVGLVILYGNPKHEDFFGSNMYTVEVQSPFFWTNGQNRIARTIVLVGIYSQKSRGTIIFNDPIGFPGFIYIYIQYIYIPGTLNNQFLMDVW